VLERCEIGSLLGSVVQCAALSFKDLEQTTEHMRLFSILQRSAALPDHSSRGDLLLNDFFDHHFYPYIALRKKRPQHDRLAYDRHVRGTIGHYKLKDIDNAVLDWWLRQHVDKDFQRSTINKHIFFVNRMLNIARHWRFIEDGGKDKVALKRLQVFELKQRFLTEAELAALLAACKREQHPFLYLFVKLLALTGARKGEARYAKWRDIDVARREWTIPISKNGRARRILLSPAAIEVLHDVRLQAERLYLPVNSADYVFINPKTRQHYDSFYAAFHKARARAGLPEVRIHDLRHSFASFLINKGATIYEVQKLLGHQHITITERYAHLLPSTLYHRLDVVSEAISGKGI
jgi:integrase